VRLGYAFGGSGIALFMLYLHLATSSKEYLTYGRRALDFELAHAKEVNGKHAGFPALATEELVDDPVLSCYWDDGTAGVCTTLVRYAAVAPDAALESWRIRMEPDVCRKYTVFPPLFRGLAGLGNCLLDLWGFTGDERYLAEAWQVAEGVLLFRAERREGIAFPGEQAMRESADLATGSAGIAMFLSRLLNADGGISSNYNFVVDELLPPWVWPSAPPHLI
jgi:lantibiotic modifying enzyme